MTYDTIYLNLSPDNLESLKKNQILVQIQFKLNIKINFHSHEKQILEKSANLF